MNKQFQVDVYNHSGASDAPVRLRVEISTARADEIQRLAALVGKHTDSFWMHTITAWDYSPEWLNPAYDAEGNEIDGLGEEERMDCCEIVVTHNEFYYQALVKDCDIFCFSDRIPLTELPEPGLADEAKWPYGD
jgi:hypothetical protein